jgi:hypothetical protein
MNVWSSVILRLYRILLAFYPKGFRSTFGEEMFSVFEATMLETNKMDWPRRLMVFGREIRDWPAAVWREHLRSRKQIDINLNNLAWKPLNAKEFLAGLALFALPIFPTITRLIFGYNTLTLKIANSFVFIVLLSGLVVIILGVKNGFPRWTVPYFGTMVIGLSMLQAVYPIWGLLADDVRLMIKYQTKTLAARIQYSVLLESFFWLVSFMVLSLLILILTAWPRTRKLAQRIRQDWTLMSFMVYSSLVLDLELIFEEYTHDEVWKIASRICLFLGAWIYLKTADQRKRIWTLIIAATLFFGIVAVGQWVVLPLQSWGDFYGYDHWTYRRVMLSGTLTGWVSTLLFMLIPDLLTLIPQSKQIDHTLEETFTTT